MTKHKYDYTIMRADEYDGDKNYDLSNYEYIAVQEDGTVVDAWDESDIQAILEGHMDDRVRDAKSNNRPLFNLEEAD